MKFVTSAGLGGVMLLGGCGPDKVTAPAPPVSTPVQVRWSAVGAPADSCQPTIRVSVAGPANARITWIGMGFHVLEGGYDDTFDLAFTQRFWGGDGVAAGESTSASRMGFALGPGPYHITFRFSYQPESAPDAIARTDEVAVVCQ